VVGVTTTKGVREEMFLQESLFDYEPDKEEQDKLSRLRALAKQGPRQCECCGGTVCVYKRKLNSGMAAVLCWLVANRMGEWTHVRQIPAYIDQGHHEIGRLAYWQLVERQENADTNKRSSGIWRPTRDGASFVLRNMAVPSHAFCGVPGHTILGFEEETITIHEALGDKFNYQELIRGE
jgi:hypothetical protein